MQLSSNLAPESTANVYALQFQGLLDDYDLLLTYLRGNEKPTDTLEKTLVKPSPYSPLASDPRESLTNGHVSITKMALYYGMRPWNPENADEHRAAIHKLEEKRASHSLQLDGGVDIDVVNRTPTAIEQQTVDTLKAANPNNPITIESLVFESVNEQISDIVSYFLPANENSLIAYLGKSVLPLLEIKQIRATPTVYLEKIMKSEQSRGLADKLLNGLDWYGGKSGEDASPSARTKLLGRAIRVWVGRKRSDNLRDVAGYPWHQRSNYGKSYQTIWAEFEQHLLDTGQASSKTEAILLALLFRPEFPGDFRIADVPSDLPYKGSAVWVNFAHGLSLAETIVPDRVRHMTFQQLVDFPLQQSIEASAEELELIACCRIPPALDWAIANGIVYERADSDYSDEVQERALTALEKHTDALKKAIQALDADPPERPKIADEEIRRFFANPLVFGRLLFITDGRMLKEDFGTDSAGGILNTPTLKGKIYSFRDVYMSGMLRTKTWLISPEDEVSNMKIRIRFNAEGEIITKENWILSTVQNRKLPDLEKLFTSKFNTYLSSSKNAYQTVLESLFASLPHDDRQAIEYGEVNIYTLRRATSGIALEDETPTITLPLRLRMGFILQLSHGGKTSCYECLPRAGIIRKRDDFSSSMLNGDRRAENIDGFLGASMTIAVRRGKRVPFDWAAHETGSQPKKNATCDAIIDQFGEAFTAITPDGYPIPISSNRASEVAILISKKFFYYDEDKLLDAARAETELERKAKRPHWLHSVKDFLPFYGSIQDLNSDDPTRRAWGLFGLLVDIASFAFPIGKFVSGTAKLATTAARTGYRAALPKFSTLSRKLLVSSAQNLNPLDGLPSLLKGTVRGVYKVNKFALRAAVKKIERLAGRSGKYDFVTGLPQITDPGRYRLLAATDDLASIKGIDDVPVRNVGSSASADFRMIDPISAKPYGPRLASKADELSLGRSAYQPLAKTDHHITVELAEKAKVREVLEVDGRTTMFIDDVAYQLDGDVLRRADRIDITDRFTAIPCRVRRAPGAVCETRYVTRDLAPTPTIGSHNESKGWAPWFGDSIYTPAIEGRVLLLKTLNYHGWLTATMEFQKGIYARIKARIPGRGSQFDTCEAGAIIVPAMDGSKHYVFTRLGAGDFYVAERLPGQSLTDSLTLRKAQTLPADLAEELKSVYTGSLNANNMARIHGTEAVELAMKTMDEIAIPIGGHVNPPDTLKLLKVDTSPGEAVLFDHSTRMIVRKSTDGAGTWSLSKSAPDSVRETTAEVFNNLFKTPVVTVAPSGQGGPKALKIDDTMRKLQKHISKKRNRPLRTPRNIAFAEIKTKDGVREIYVSVSGNQGDTGFLPLFEPIANRKEVTVAGTRYINIDSASPFPETALGITPENRLVAIPHTIENIETYTPALTARPTSLDTESKLISVIREKYPDPKTLDSITIATTMAPCDSCSVVMKQFGYDGSPDALNVIWK